MRKGKNLILATKPFAKEHRTKSWFYFLSTFFSFLLLLAIVTLPLHFLIQLGVSILLSLLLIRLFTMYHDFLHKAILHKNTLANFIFTLLGYYTLNPPSVWRRSHDYHHKHNSKLFTSSIGSFPICTKSEFINASKTDRIKYLFTRHSLTILCGYVFVFLFGMCILPLFRSPSKHWDAIIALLFHYIIAAAFVLIFGWRIAFFAFMLPAFISSFIGSYLFYAQHNFPGVTFNNKENWSYADAALHSTSYIRMSTLMRWFTGNIGYHHIHHLNSMIPFYRLPEAHRFFPEFNTVTKTSLNPLAMYKCLQLKVWDPAKKRMLKLDEVKKMC